jgi:hypothetical protein
MRHKTLFSFSMIITFAADITETRRQAQFGCEQRTLKNTNSFVVLRGKIAFNDRPGLEHLAAGGYGLGEAEYERLVGVALRRHPSDPHRQDIKGRSAAAQTGQD